MIATDVRAKPLTSTQRGAIMGHFHRLGLDQPALRYARLAIMTTLLDLDEHIGSVKNLTLGEAGQLVSTLECCCDARDLAAALAWRATRDLTSERNPL
jgi:hypothetical protein